jgi:UDP-glucose 4-epimerase
VTFASSIGVYSGVADARSPISEDTPLPPIGLHGIQASKKVLEVAGDLASRTSEVEVVAVRIPAVWGPGGHPSSQFFDLPQLVNAAVRGEVLPEVAGGAGIESVYARDAGRALVAVQASDRLQHRTYNLGSGAPTNAEVVEAIQTVVPDAVGRLAESTPAGRFELDTSRIRDETAWKPAYDLSSGVADYVAWLRAGHER